MSTDGNEKKVRKVIKRQDQTVVITKGDETRGFNGNIPIVAGAKIKVIPLGGMCEIGKNTWIIEYENEMIIIDGGLAFPSDEMPGVEIVLPDISYLIQNKNKIKGLFITHGHEDHIGGIVPMLKQFDIPVIYGPPLAIALLGEKLKDASLQDKTTLHKGKPRSTIKLGSLAFTYVRNTHSIADSFSLIIHTPLGQIVHSGDFKFDFTPVDGEFFDVYSLAKAGEEGALLLISDSTNVEKEGYTPSERSVYNRLEEEFFKATGRIIITTFASQVHRIKQILDITQKTGRKVAIYGRSMLLLATISKELGHMTFPDGLIINTEDVNKMDDDKIVILTTGSQGEPLSALTRMAFDEHKQITIQAKDTVIISATPIPGNERSVANVVNALSAKGAKVIYGRDAHIHVSGHACKEEQRMLLNIVRPKYFLPAHGEYRMLVMHGNLGVDCGVDPQNVFIMENGDVLELSSDSAKLNGQVPAGIIMVDSTRVGDIDKTILEQRHKLGSEGLLSVMATVKNGKIISEPIIEAKGLILMQEDTTSGHFITDAKKTIVDALKASLEKNGKNMEDLQAKVKEELRDLIHKELRREPLLQVVILESK
ncbi:MAG: ribonuclease J [Candidatus Melainabacteria bacterium]|nr:ribonuclease J [Candidatus Melainabacteria bacterium]MBI3309041.1 ribonuclease J [Candidatus Melainabacteria bacterium]